MNKTLVLFVPPCYGRCMRFPHTLCLCAAFILPNALADDWKPGETVSFDFPELGKDYSKNPTCFRVRIPDKYTPSQPVPLLLWLSGGDGDNNPHAGISLVGAEEFLVAAFPYPEGIHPWHAMGENKMDRIWEYHKPMVEKLFAAFPNIDPRMRFAAGMSNGAHAIGYYVAQGKREFIENFNAFILIEGGCRERQSVRKLPGAYAYLTWGEQGNGKNYMSAVRDAFSDAGINTTTRAMPGVGHAFPPAEIPFIRKWIEAVARPGLKPKTAHP